MSEMFFVISFGLAVNAGITYETDPKVATGKIFIGISLVLIGIFVDEKIAKIEAGV